ncbi:MAG: hypothetical protein HOP33_06070 [Verrucomicrobia bacterium]|nr:hypothetical protein [Verrucomicrobiota bacterium]
MKTTNETTDVSARVRARLVMQFKTRYGALLAIAIAAFVSLSSHAQQAVTLTCVASNLFVAPNDLTFHTNAFSIRTTNGLDQVNLNVGNVPPGVTVTLSSNAVTPISDTINYVSNIFATIVVGSVTPGDYTLTIEAYGGTFTQRTNTLTLHVNNNLSVWAAADPTNSTAWSTAANWGPAAAPVAGSDVKFENEVGSPATNFVDASITLGSLSFVPFRAGLNRTTVIAPGATLAVTNGFLFIPDSEPAANRNSALFVIGTNGASLVVSNRNFSVNSFNGGGAGTTLNMGALDNFRADVTRFSLGDVTLASQQGAYGGQNMGTLTMAKTNIIRASFSGDYSGFEMTNAITFLDNGDPFNNGTASTINLGSSNALFADSIRLSGSRVGNAANTVRLPNTGGATNVAYLRNTDGGRVSLVAVALDDGIANQTANSQGLLDFRNGTVDLQAETMILGQYRSNSAPAGASARGVFSMQNGSVDVNNLFLGYQMYPSEAFCRGTLNITSNGTFVVNNVFEMGYTTGGTNTATGASSSFGQINISSNGVLRVKGINIGGPANVSVQNRITMTTGSTIVLTNTIGSDTAKADQLNMTASSLTLHVSDANTKIFVNAITTTGSGNIINIASISGVGADYPITIPIITYASGTPAFSIGSAPAGFFPDLQIGSGVVNLIIKTNQGRVLTWRGNVSGDWDTTTANWITAGNVATTFQNGDYVKFDDSLTNTPSTNVNIIGTLSVGQFGNTPGITVSNITKHYKFQGGGTLSGSAALLKAGAGSLTIDTGVTSDSINRVNGGSLLGSGNIAATTLEAGTTFNFSGNLNGSLVSSNATATVLSGGLINGPVSIQMGAITNLGTITGTITFGNGTYLSNNGTINATVPWTITTNSVLVNNGIISQTGPSGGNAGLNVGPSGTLMGVGTINLGGGTTPADGRVILAGGGTLIIGNSDNQIASVTFDTRLDMNPGCTNIIDVIDPAITNNDVLNIGSSGEIQWGDNNTGGGVRIVNLGSPFSLATVVYPVNWVNGINTPRGNARRPIVTPPPGTGLSWDTTQVVTNGFLMVAGQPTLANSFTTTNITFSWPNANIGWRLEIQTNSLSVGISTNWENVSGSANTNFVIQPIYTTNPAVFFRLSYP